MARGRALSAFNLVIFLGVFSVQWLVGLGIDLGRALGLAEGAAFRATLAVFLACCVLSYAWLVFFRPRREAGAASLPAGDRAP